MSDAIRPPILCRRLVEMFRGSHNPLFCAEGRRHFFSPRSDTITLEANEIEPFELEKQNGSESKGG
jgi:hypothetical protein